MTPTSHDRPSRRHGLWMVVGCLLIAGVGLAVFRFGSASGGVLPYLMFLLCPLMHLVMHRAHRQGQQGGEHTGSDGHDAR